MGKKEIQQNRYAIEELDVEWPVIIEAEMSSYDKVWVMGSNDETEYFSSYCNIQRS